MRRVFHSSTRLLIDPPISRGVYGIVNLLQVNLTSKTLSEPMSTRHISKTMNQTQAWKKLLEHQYRKTDLFIISNEHLLKAKQNETQLEDLPDGNRSHGKLQKRRSRSKFTRISKGARRDREPSRLPWKKIMNLFNKNKAIKRYVRSHIVNSVPNSSALKKISSLN